MCKAAKSLYFPISSASSLRDLDKSEEGVSIEEIFYNVLAKPLDIL